jgi:hypothetical protein
MPEFAPDSRAFCRSDLSPLTKPGREGASRVGGRQSLTDHVVSGGQSISARLMVDDRPLALSVVVVL